LRGKAQFPDNITDLTVDKVIILQKSLHVEQYVTHCHFPRMLDLQEAEIIFMCNREKESVSKTVGKFYMAGQPCKNMLFLHAKSMR